MSKSYNNNQIAEQFDEYAAAKEQFFKMIESLETEDMHKREHGDVEQFVSEQGTEVLRKAVQAHLNSRAKREPLHDNVTGADGVERNHHRQSCKRDLMTVFGQVEVKRIGYSQREQTSLFPLDAQLNLPENKYSHGMQWRAVENVIHVSFETARGSIASTTGGKIPKHQMQDLMVDIAQDFDDFYKTREAKVPEQTLDPLVLTTDGKGIVMINKALREQTKKAADNEQPKARLSPGEKGNRKRMATVASVYSTARHKRTAETIMHMGKNQTDTVRPKVRDKRVWANIERPAKDVIDDMVEEAFRRDPEKCRPWVALVDGQPQQMKNLEASIRRYGAEHTVIIMDLIHILEYLWTAAYVFFAVGSDAAEKWVSERALAILKGKASHVAAGMRRSATKRNLSKDQRAPIDTCARYLLNNRRYLRYDEYLKQGFPIATGVIEGACRHLINDRMDITGARWGLSTAEAVLRLRSLNSSGDLQEYWQFHRKKELQRTHIAKYECLPWQKAA
jgi:hypothetical protein